MKQLIFSNKSFGTDIALLILRVGASMMLLTHGWAKITNFSERLNTFADPIGLGSALSLQLVIFAEFFCAILLILGFMSRVVLIPLIINMAVITFVVHAGDPFNKQELPLLFLVSFVVLMLTGPGKLSMDAQILRKRRY
ncbi:MAG: DoxX family protein [Lunatimonas sp.]|uniref:DoxX family protein n=1 Tax=Lunatimonas sp. TaxID=2060141 RepID=UPI00263AF5EF|nr:DoxX family protein [Lunatimonas sp.]MCC5938437.1 DoxX family protein [Lunatimonas sp.]